MWHRRPGDERERADRTLGVGSRLRRTNARFVRRRAFRSSLLDPGLARLLRSSRPGDERERADHTLGVGSRLRPGPTPALSGTAAPCAIAVPAMNPKLADDAPTLRGIACPAMNEKPVVPPH